MTKYDVSSMPTFILLKEDKVLGKLVGANKSGLEELLATNVS